MGKVAKMLYIVVQDNGETYVIAFSKHKNRTMYFDFGHKLNTDFFVTSYNFLYLHGSL